MCAQLSRGLENPACLYLSFFRVGQDCVDSLFVELRQEGYFML